MTELAIEPINGPIDASVVVPGSKSITNRALVCAALAEGRSQLTNVLVSDDTTAMLEAIRTLGAEVVTSEAGPDTVAVEVTGVAGRLHATAEPVEARMSGTTARFLAPVLALGGVPMTLTGHPQLLARPMAPVLDGIRQLGATVTELGEPGHLPVVVDGSSRHDEAATVAVSGDVSSQFLSGLLLTGPAVAGGLRVELTSTLVSRPYVDLTTAVMAAFGAGVEEQGDGRFVVAGTGYRGTAFTVEPDASAASYFFAAAAICGGRVTVEGLGAASRQGDLQFVEVLREMGCTVDVAEQATTVAGTGSLHGVEVDLGDFSDTAPTLGVVAAFASSPTRVRGIGFIRRKETDRIAAVVAELRRCGVDAEEETDGFVVRPSAPGPTGGRVHTYDDHRMAMSFAVLGLRAPGTVILGAECVAKTFPGFFGVLATLR